MMKDLENFLGASQIDDVPHHLVAPQRNCSVLSSTAKEENSINNNINNQLTHHKYLLTEIKHTVLVAPENETKT
jgi:hypothetical protein